MAGFFNREDLIKRFTGAQPQGNKPRGRIPGTKKMERWIQDYDRFEERKRPEVVNLKGARPGQWVVTKGRDVAQIVKVNPAVRLADGTWVQPSVDTTDMNGNSLLVFQDQLSGLFNTQEDALSYAENVIPKRTKGSRLESIKNYITKLCQNLPAGVNPATTNVPKPKNVPVPTDTTGPVPLEEAEPESAISQLTDAAGKAVSDAEESFRGTQKVIAKNRAVADTLLAKGPTDPGAGNAPIMTSQPPAKAASVQSKKSQKGDDEDPVAAFIEAFRRGRKQEEEKWQKAREELFGVSGKPKDQPEQKSHQIHGAPRRPGSSLGRLRPAIDTSRTHEEFSGTINEPGVSLRGKYVIVPESALVGTSLGSVPSYKGYHIMRIYSKEGKDPRTGKIKGVYVYFEGKPSVSTFVFGKDVLEGKYFKSSIDALQHLASLVDKTSSIKRAFYSILKKCAFDEPLYDQSSRSYKKMDPVSVAQYYFDRYYTPADVHHIGKVAPDPQQSFEKLRDSLSLVLGPYGYKISYDPTTGEVFMFKDDSPDIKITLGTIGKYSGPKVSFKVPDPKGKVHPLPEVEGVDLNLDRKTPPNIPVNDNEFENGGGKIVGHGEKEGLEGQSQPLIDSKGMKKFIKKIRKEDPTPVFKLSV